MEKLESIFFYHLEKAIKTYRQYAQNRLNENGHKITIDQWLVLKVLKENPKVTQNVLAEMVFKDKASVTRIIEILVQAGHLKRALHESNRRRFKLTVTKKGEDAIKAIVSTVKQNRKKALSGIAEKDVRSTEKVLMKIITNCQK
jgi:DNA-binding MarR family transcriptional regulator